MIGIDTHILLRYLLDDDELQSPIAVSLIRDHDDVLLCNLVLVETIRTLAGNKYRVSSEDLVAAIYNLFREPSIRIENSQLVWTALQIYEQSSKIGNEALEFPDVLMCCLTEQYAHNRELRFNAVYTFDSGSKKLEKMRIS